MLAAEHLSTYLRFLSLFAGAVPLVALEMNALQVEDKVLLHLARLLDQRFYRVSDPSVVRPELKIRSRACWTHRTSEVIMVMIDWVLDVANGESRSFRSFSQLLQSS